MSGLTLERTLIVFVKELVDNLRDRRTITTALFFGPIFGPAIFAVLINMTVKLATEEYDLPLDLPVVGAERAPNLMQYLAENNVKVTPGPQDPKQAVRNKDLPLVLVIPEQYPKDFRDGKPAVLELYSDSAEAKASKQVNRAERVLNGYGRQLAAQRLLVRGVSPQVMQPVVVEDVDVASQRAKAAMLLSMIPYFVIAGGLMGGFYLAADTTAGERERFSLEPLLSTAATRAELVIGKLGATAVYSAASLSLTLIAYAITIQFLPLEEIGMRGGIEPLTCLKIIGLALPYVLLGAALMVAIASFAKTYKEAQTYLTFVTMIPIIPLFMTMFGAPKTELWMVATPTLSQHLLVTQLLKGESIPPLHYAVSIGVTLSLGLLLSWVAVRLYSRERILG
jgi:sodium transport system permease protein